MGEGFDLYTNRVRRYDYFFKYARKASPKFVLSRALFAATGDRAPKYALILKVRKSLLTKKSAKIEQSVKIG